MSTVYVMLMFKTLPILPIYPVQSSDSTVIPSDEMSDNFYYFSVQIGIFAEIKNVLVEDFTII